MDEKEVLAYCEAIITEVDIEIMNWQHEVDLMSFIGQDVPLVMYTNGERVEVGTARLVHDDGALKMTGQITDDRFVDQHQHTSLDSFSVGFDTVDKQLRAVALSPKALSHFRIDENGEVEQLVDLRRENRNTELPIGLEGSLPDKLREQIRRKINESLEKEND